MKYQYTWCISTLIWAKHSITYHNVYFWWVFIEKSLKGCEHKPYNTISPEMAKAMKSDKDSFKRNFQKIKTKNKACTNCSFFYLISILVQLNNNHKITFFAFRIIAEVQRFKFLIATHKGCSVTFETMKSLLFYMIQQDVSLRKNIIKED